MAHLARCVLVGRAASLRAPLATTAAPARRVQQPARLLRSSAAHGHSHTAAWLRPSTAAAAAAVAAAAVGGAVWTAGVQQPWATCEAAPAPTRQTVVDPLSKLEFPTTLRPTKASGEHSLVGLGTRTVTFLKFQVYTVGFYFNEAQLVAALAGRPVGSVPLDEAFVEVLLSEGVERSLRLTPCRNADFSHLRDGFGRALMQRVGKVLATEEEQAAATDEINELKRAFPKGTLEIGEEMTFYAHRNTLRIEAKGELLIEKESPFLAKTLFLAYFDCKPVSTNAHASLQAGFEKMLANL